MPIYYKGVGPGNFFLDPTNDPITNGFQGRNLSIQGNRDRVMEHIRRGNAYSPYVSLSKSFGVAKSYACSGPLGFATPTRPGYVYEILLSNPLPQGLLVIDPVKEVIEPVAKPPDHVPYHHDGDQKFILGVVDPLNQLHYLQRPAEEPTPGSTPRPPNLTSELECIIRSLRDSEVLVIGAIPSNSVGPAHKIVGP